MAGRLSFSIAVNLLTENFKKGAAGIKDSLRSMQMQIITFAAALGFAGFGLQGLVTRMIETARATSRAITALKNVSGSTGQFADNLKFVNDVSKKYGVEINSLTSAYAKFKAAGDSVGMSTADQRKIFEATSRAATAYGMSAEDTNLTFLAITQMMSKGKISSEELRRQLGERLPVAMAAMAKAAGVPINKLDELLKKGKLMSADVLPKFADALNEMIPAVDTDNLETSINRMQNMFTKFTEGAGVKEKYKALIDGMTGILEAGANNMRNIVVGIVAAIVFVITNSMTKVYRAYAVTGEQIVANAAAAQARMIAATAARVEAEIALDKAKSAAFFASESQRLATARAVAKAETTLKARVAAEHKAIEAEKLAATQAAAIKTGGVWATAGAAIKGTFMKMGAALKSMWNAFAPAIIITAITIIGQKLYELATATTSAEKAMASFNAEVLTEGKNLNNLFEAYKKANEGSKEKDRLLNLIKSKYGEYLKGLIDEKGHITDIDKAQRQANESLRQSIALRVKNAAIGAVQEEEVKKQASLLGNIRSRIAKSKGDDVANQAMEYIGAKINNDKLSFAEAQKEITDYLKLVTNEPQYVSKYTGMANNDLFDLLSSIQKVREESKAIEDQFKGIIGDYVQPIEPTATHTDTGAGDPDKSAEKKAQKRLEALRKLYEADQQRLIDKLAFDNDIRQKEIDNMDEGFAKQTAQLKLNYDKELQAVEEYKKKIAKAQLETAKDQFVSKTGTTKGFEAYYANLDLSKTMPEGLKPSDIEARINEMMSAAKAAFVKGGSEIAIEMQKMIDEEMLRYASPLDQQLTDIKKFYADRIKLAQGNNALLKQLEINRNKDIEAARLQHQERLLQFQNEYSEKEIAISGKRYLFEADRQKELLDKQIQNAKKRVLNLERQQMNAPNDRGIYEDLQKARQEVKGLSKEMGKLPMQKAQEIAGYIAQGFGMLGSLFAEDGAMANETIGQLTESLGSIAQGFAQGGWIGAAMATVEQGINLINKASQASKIHKEALKAIAESIKAQEHAYEMALLLQSLEYKGGTGIFGTDEWGKAANAANVYRDSIEKGKKALQELSEVDIVTGHKKTGLFGTGKGKDTYTELLKLYPELIDAEGKLDAEKAKSILTNRKMSDEDKVRLQSALDYIDIQEQAFTEMQSYLTGIFGDLGNTILDTFVNAFKGGEDAMSNFYSSASDMLANLVKGFINSMRIAPIIEQATKEAMTIQSNTNLTAEEKNKKLLDVTGNFINNVMSGADAVYADLEYWGNYIKGITGKNPFAADATSQSSSKGGFDTMTQDQAGVLSARFTGLFEVGVQIKEMLTGISISTSNTFKQNIAIGDELKKQTDILNEQRQIAQKTFFLTETISEGIKSIKTATDKLDNIEKNTKGLISK